MKNYKVNVADEIAKLDFTSVKEACAGIEAVIKEFPLAATYLEELNVLERGGIMNASRFLNAIYFNIEYFSNREKLLSALTAGVKTGYYPKNMSIFGVGAHEMGHIIEKWLTEKHVGTIQDLNHRVFAEKIITAAYGDVMRSTGKFKPLNTLKKEICEHALRENCSECFADTICDYVLNKENAAVLSQAAWQRLKEELIKMLAPGQTKLEQFSIEVFEKYSIFNDVGDIIGVKDDAPTNFKEAYEHDKKMKDELWEQGFYT